MESTLGEHRAQARELLALLAAAPGGSETLRVGVTGAPGVGKSTLIEALGRVVLAREDGVRVACLVHGGGG